MSVSYDGDPIARLKLEIPDGGSNLGARDHLQEDSAGVAGEERLQHLQAWVCALLIKNQQLRMAIHDLTREREGKDGSLEAVD